MLLVVIPTLLFSSLRCWTKNKEEKLEYFKNTAMWYLSDSCALPTLIRDGPVERLIKDMYR